MEQLFMDKLLGKIFIYTQSYNCPDIYQIIGWTKNSVNENAKRRYVIVEPIKLITLGADGYGGSAKIDKTSITSTINKPIFRGNQKLCVRLPKENDDNDEIWLTRGSVNSSLCEYFHEIKNVDEEYNWCWY